MVATQTMKPWKRAVLIAAIVPLLGLVLAMIAPALVPQADAFKLGEVVGEFCFGISAAVFLATWLWLSKHRIMAMGVPVAVFVLLSIGALLVRDDTRRTAAAFKQSVEKGFTLVGAEGGRRLSQQGFGLTIEPPGNNYTESPVRWADPQTAVWVFQNAEEGKVLSVIATLRRFTDEKSLQDYLHGIAFAIRESAERKGLQMNMSRESVKWGTPDRYGDAEGSAGYAYFCIRVIASEGAETDHPVSFGAQAFAADLPTARAMATSLRIEAKN